MSSIEVDRPGNKLRVTIRTSRPGIIIGRKGAEIEKLKQDLAKKTKREVFIDIQEVHKPELDAQLVSESIALQLEKRVAFRRAMRKAVDSALRFGCKGIKVRVSGRLNGAEIARSEWYLQGQLPLHTLRADIDYGFAEAHTTYGVIGVKAWVYKGEILDRRQAARPAQEPEPRRDARDRGTGADATATDATGTAGPRSTAAAGQRRRRRWRNPPARRCRRRRAICRIRRRGRTPILPPLMRRRSRAGSRKRGRKRAEALPKASRRKPSRVRTSKDEELNPMLMPKKVKYRKQQRGRMTGKAWRGSSIAFGEFGLKAMECGWITDRQIEAARVAMTRSIKRGGKVWIRLFPDKPITKKPAETRMGKGKGAPEQWVAVIRPGKILFEMEGVDAGLSPRQAMRLAAHKLPHQTKFVTREQAE